MPDIRHELLIGASTEKVFDALTTQEGLSAWWTPGTKAKPEVDSTARFNFGADYFKEMKITELVPNQCVKWTCTAGAAEWIGTSLCFELQAFKNSDELAQQSELTGQIQQQENSNHFTVLRFQHNDWKDHTRMFAECNYTWALFLRSLKLLCETGNGKPWPTQHQV